MSGVREFFRALAIPLVVGVLFAVSLAVLGPRGPLVALLLNAFLLSEIAGICQFVRPPVPAGFFRPLRMERAHGSTSGLASDRSSGS
jgi:hypothetical protein